MSREMKKTVHEMVCLIDKSGSMRGRENTTINSYNQMINGKKKELEKLNQTEIGKERELYLTTTLFSDLSETLYTHTPIHETKPMTECDFVPEGNTALFDAIGKTFAQVEAMLTGEEDPKVAVMIITDGLENASKEFSGDDIMALIQEKQSKGWEIMLFGTNMEMINIARRAGVHEKNLRRYPDTEDGLYGSYQMASQKFTSMLRM